MLIDLETQRRLDAFTKYARFVASTFDVTVELDGYAAKTDGKVITLPVLSSLSSTELDALYAVLLHEVGHIRYTSFDKELFDRVPTTACFMAFNSLEDARIENLLVKELAGARDIFQELYTQHIHDSVLTERVFGVTYPVSDTWFAICLYAHAVLSDINILSTFSDLIDKSTLGKLHRFVDQHDLDTLLHSAPFATQEDALELALDLYDRFFEGRTDASDSIDYKEKEKVLDRVLESLTTPSKALQAAAQEVDALRNLIKTKQLELDTYKKASAPRRAQLQNEYDKARDRQAAFEDVAQARNDYQDAEGALVEALVAHERASARNTASLDKQKSEIQRLEESMGTRLSKLQARIEELRAKVETASPLRREAAQARLREEESNKESLQGALEEKLAAKKQELQEKASRQAERLKTAVKALSQAQHEKDTAHDALFRAQARAPAIAAMPGEEFSQSISDLASQVSRLKAELDTIKNPPDTSLLTQLRHELEGKMVHQNGLVLSELGRLDKIMAGAGFPGTLLPEFEATPQWPEIDAVQQAFDKEATQKSGQWVQNGVGLGTGNRNLVLQLERARQSVESIDLAEHFQDCLGTSPLSAFAGPEGSLTSDTMSGELSLSSGNRRHIPLTTQFDTITIEKGVGKGSVLAATHHRHTDTIRQVKQLCRTRLRFAKKDHFHGNKEEGTLDARSMWKLASGTDDHYFEVNRPVPVNKVVSTILVDISGSMDKPVTEHGERLRAVALTLSEGLSEVHIKHEILGYHAPICALMQALPSSSHYNRRGHRLDTVVYRTFTDRTSAGLAGLEIQATDNSDGESLRVATARLRRLPAKSRILFILTDGLPYLAGSDTQVLDADLLAALAEAEAAKITIFALGFLPGPESLYAHRYTKLETDADLVTFVKEKLTR